MLTCYFCPGCGHIGLILWNGAIYCNNRKPSWTHPNHRNCSYANGNPFKRISKVQVRKMFGFKPLTYHGPCDPVLLAVHRRTYGNN